MNSNAAIHCRIRQTILNSAFHLSARGTSCLDRIHWSVWMKMGNGRNLEDNENSWNCCTYSIIAYYDLIHGPGDARISRLLPCFDRIHWMPYQRAARTWIKKFPFYLAILTEHRFIKCWARLGSPPMHPATKSQYTIGMFLAKTTQQKLFAHKQCIIMNQQNSITFIIDKFIKNTEMGPPLIVKRSVSHSNCDWMQHNLYTNPSRIVEFRHS